MTSAVFLICNLALGFYNVGTIWAHEVDIFRTWRRIPADRFHSVQRAHWRKLPYWIFAPVGLALAGGAALLAFHPPGAPPWALEGAFGCQALSLFLTAACWGRWQARLSQDPSGPESIYLKRIVATHWLRTALISGSGAFLVFAAMKAFPR